MKKTVSRNALLLSATRVKNCCGETDRYRDWGGSTTVSCHPQELLLTETNRSQVKVGDEGIRVSASALQTLSLKLRDKCLLSSMFCSFNYLISFSDPATCIWTSIELAKTLCSHLTRCNLFLTKKRCSKLLLKNVG